MKLFFIATCIAVLFLSSCDTKTDNCAQVTEPPSKDFSLIGKRGILTSPAMKKIVTYHSDSIMSWEIIDKDSIVASEYEYIHYKKINDNVYFLNWIDVKGQTISQVIDTKKGTASTHTMIKSSKKTQERNAEFVDAKFEYDTTYLQNPTASVTVNNSNIIYIGVDNELDIRKGRISSAMLQVVAHGGGSSIQGSGAQRIIRAKQEGKVVITISGGKDIVRSDFVFYAKHLPN